MLIFYSFLFFCLTQPEIEPKSTVSVAAALITQTLVALYQPDCNQNTM